MTERSVTVTVGIPTFNRARYLRESMASVLAQSYPDFRLLVCDNASTDATEETVRSFDDPRIDYVRSDENIGMIANFNRVIERAATELVVLLPDDDLLYPDHLRRTVEVLAGQRASRRAGPVDNPHACVCEWDAPALARLPGQLRKETRATVPAAADTTSTPC